MRFLKRWLFDRIRRKAERFPALLTIELTSRCNARCIMCPRETLERKGQDMSFDMVGRVVASCKGQPLKKANLFWMGDPFVNSRFVEYARYIRRELPRLRLYASTNGGALREETSRAIVDEGFLDVVNLDIDGTTKDVSESIRRGVDFDRMMENVHFLLDYRRKKRRRRPRIRATMIRMRPNEGQVKEFVDYWTPLVDKVDITHYHTWFGAVSDLFPSDHPLHGEPEGRFDFACRHPWDEVVVAVDGRVGLCCLDHELEVVIGDVNRQTLKEIWTGPVMTDVRRKLLELRYAEVPPCSKCRAHIYQQNNSWTNLQR